jgi:hypothetical protein
MPEGMAVLSEFCAETHDGADTKLNTAAARNDRNVDFNPIILVLSELS